MTHPTSETIAALNNPANKNRPVVRDVETQQFRPLARQQPMTQILEFKKTELIEKGKFLFDPGTIRRFIENYTKTIFV